MNKLRSIRYIDNKTNPIIDKWQVKLQIKNFCKPESHRTPRWDAPKHNVSQHWHCITCCQLQMNLNLTFSKNFQSHFKSHWNAFSRNWNNEKWMLFQSFKIIEILFILKYKNNPHSMKINQINNFSMEKNAQKNKDWYLNTLKWI